MSIRWTYLQLRSLGCIVLFTYLMHFGGDRVAADGPFEFDTLQLTLRETVTLDSNVLRLGDLCAFPPGDDAAASLEDLPIAPTPRVGITQSWSRDDLEKCLTLRGVASDNIRWLGADSVRVQRGAASENFPSQTTGLDSTRLRSAPPDAAQVDSSALSTAEFTPAFMTPVSLSQAERVVISAIQSYLQVKSGGAGKWGIQPKIPAQFAKDLMQRRQIISIAGGNPPWDGQQTFSLLIRTADGETVVDVPTEVRLPDLVVAAKGPLARDRVIQESDLVWLALPPASRISADECFTDLQAVIGKQLRRAVSTQQPIRVTEVGEPFAVHTGETVNISVYAGSVRVESFGRAIESGAVDDVVQIEVLPQRKRIAARVVSERSVEIIAGGGPMAITEPRAKP